jgi:hypothetical protein
VQELCQQTFGPLGVSGHSRYKHECIEKVMFVLRRLGDVALSIHFPGFANWKSSFLFSAHFVLELSNMSIKLVGEGFSSLSSSISPYFSRRWYPSETNSWKKVRINPQATNHKSYLI